MVMKVNIRYSIKKVILSVAAIMWLACGISSAQDPAPAADKKASAIQLSFYKKADLNKVAVAKVTAKNEKRKFVPAKGVEVSFYILKDKEQTLLKKVNTDADGKAIVLLPKDLPVNDLRQFTITAKVENDKAIEDAKEEASLRESNLIIKLDPADTGRTVTAVLTEQDKNGKSVPVKDVAIKLFVVRLFGVMPASSDATSTTDENGEATFTLPKDIKGDSAGHMTLLAKIEDNDQLGNVEASSIAPWGVPLLAEKDPFPRAMWMPTAPIPLIIVLSVLFFCVWSTYLYLFYQVYKISKFKSAKQ
jgi:hypothetical protein